MKIKKTYILSIFLLSTFTNNFAVSKKKIKQPKKPITPAMTAKKIIDASKRRGTRPYTFENPFAIEEIRKIQKEMLEKGKKDEVSLQELKDYDNFLKTAQLHDAIKNSSQEDTIQEQISPIQGKKNGKFSPPKQERRDPRKNNAHPSQFEANSQGFWCIGCGKIVSWDNIEKGQSGHSCPEK